MKTYFLYYYLITAIYMGVFAFIFYKRITKASFIRKTIALISAKYIDANGDQMVTIERIINKILSRPLFVITQMILSPILFIFTLPLQLQTYWYQINIWIAKKEIQQMKETKALLDNVRERINKTKQQS